MNRKQKVAVVVGVVVLVLLVLFPPWRAVEGPFNDSVLFDWFGRDPIHVWVSRTGGTPMPREPEILHVTSRSRFVGKLEIQHGLLVVLQIATLALTVAAVIVLKERKAGG